MSGQFAAMINTASPNLALSLPDSKFHERKWIPGALQNGVENLPDRLVRGYNPRKHNILITHKDRVDYSQFGDEELLSRMELSDEEALSELYDRYNRLVFSLAVNSLGDRHLAEEVTQDVFLRVWNKAETYRPEQGKVRTWMISITRYRSIDLIRRRNIRPEGNQISWEEEPASPLSASQDVEGEVESAQERQRVQQALHSLPDDQRRALALAYFHGYTQTEIAQVLGEPLGTVKTRIRSGMQKLRTILQEETGVRR